MSAGFEYPGKWFVRSPRGARPLYWLSARVRGLAVAQFEKVDLQVSCSDHNNVEPFFGKSS